MPTSITACRPYYLDNVAGLRIYSFIPDQPVPLYTENLNSNKTACPCSTNCRGLLARRPPPAARSMPASMIPRINYETVSPQIKEIFRGFVVGCVRYKSVDVGAAAASNAAAELIAQTATQAIVIPPSPPPPSPPPEQEEENRKSGS
jgi:hypothetical protein